MLIKRKKLLTSANIFIVSRMTTRYRFRPYDLEAVAYYHVVSRCDDRKFLLEAEEKTILLKQIASL
jgi:hypothetical protein